MSEIRVTNILGENGSNPVGLSTGFTVGPTSGTIWFGESSAPKIGSGFYVIRLGDT